MAGLRPGHSNSISGPKIKKAGDLMDVFHIGWARGMIIFLGFVLTVIYAWRYWF
jgi:hypothetical protein